MKKLRALAALLSVFTFAAVFTGCEEKPVTTDTTVTSTGTETATTKETLAFEGYNFSFVGANVSLKGTALWYDSPKTPGQQEIMDFYYTLADKYGCGFTNIGTMREEDLSAAFAAGEKAADFIYVEDDIFGDAVVNGYARRLDTGGVRAAGMDVLDPAQFDTVSVKAGLIGGAAYICRITNETLRAQTGVFYCFNKTLAAGAGYPADMIYQAVRNGEWTWDVFIDICHAGAVYNEETGLYDICGVTRVFTNSELATMCRGIVYWNGERYVSGLAECSTLAALNTVVNRMIMDPRVMFSAMSKGIGYYYGSSSSRQIFYDQKSVFGTFDNLIDPYNGCGFLYGVVPLPRGGAMNGYVSLLRNFQGYICQSANPDWEKACAIMGLLGTALNRPEEAARYFKYMTCDAESIEMLESYILLNIQLDVSGFCSEAWDIFWQDIRGGIRAGKTAAEAVSENGESFENALEEYWGKFNDRQR